MSTLDVRTRILGDNLRFSPKEFLGSVVPGLPEGNRAHASESARRLNLAPLTFDVEGQRITLQPGPDHMEIREGGDASLLVQLDTDAFSDLMQDAISTFGVQRTGRACIKVGTIDAFVAWEPVLRTLLDGRPPYKPGSIAIVNSDGSKLALGQTFTLADDPDEIGHFLSQAGFLHIKGVFSESEMAEVSHDLDLAMASSAQDDGASWWAQTTDGDWYPARILGFNQNSPALRELLLSDRFRTVGSFTDDAYIQANPNVGDTAEGLYKKVGVVAGISDVSWHKDCSMGGHSRHCCSLTVGISVTGAGPESGELGVVPGSHRANVVPLGIEGLDLQRLPLPTETGDITVHCSCTLHMSRPPVSSERRVVYTGFALAPRPEDLPVEVDEEQKRRDRASLNRIGRSDEAVGSQLSSFEL